MVWNNLKSLFDPSRMLTYALFGEVILLILILFACLLQHIGQQQAATEVTLQVLMALRYDLQRLPLATH